MAEKKTRHLTDEEFDDIGRHNYEQGLEHADKKWVDAVDERIAELELQVGIPELRQLKEKTKYRWEKTWTKPKTKGGSVLARFQKNKKKGR